MLPSPLLLEKFSRFAENYLWYSFDFVDTTIIKTSASFS